MGLRSLGVCIVFLLCSEWHKTRAVTVTFESTVGVKGRTGHRLRCQYIQASGETFRTLNIYKGSVSTPASLIINMQGADAGPIWAAAADSALRGRANISGSPGEAQVSVDFQDTVCEDSDRTYRCDFQYLSSTGTIETRADTTVVTVEAPPTDPGMSVSTTSSSVPEFSLLTFTCAGNVGRPEGAFHWFKYEGSKYENMTSKASPGTVFPGTGDDSCTYTRTSTLIYNATRTQIDQNLVIRCHVYHPSQGNDVNPNAECNTFCKQSQQIAVHYPVSVSVSPDQQTVIEGQSVTLTCTPDSNPLAYGTMWYRGNMTDVLSNTTQLQLTNLQLNDTGDYTCVSYNDVDGSTYNSSATVMLTVSMTPPPTTPTTPTTPGPTTTDGGGGGGGGGDGDSDASSAGTDLVVIVVPIVVAVVLVIVIIVIVVIVRRRRNRKEVEEPPEKPFNNHSGINTLATRPDLVSNDKIYPSGYNNDAGFKNEDGLTYAELQFDNKPRSRRPLALDDTHTDYSDVSMPQV